MKNSEIEQWLAYISQQNQGQITVVQTIRNAIMSASILASVALIALMGALATAHSKASEWILASIALLVLSATCSAISISFLARLSFQTQFEHVHFELSANRLRHALNLIRGSAVLFISALVVAAIDLWW
ncbi:MAG: DUF599 domain-containing protein [Burkholderiales bacterium]|jgi:hypothetical protein|nr:DUF599 domain-containing protein [Burkholderiales bacterium]MCE1176036.1 DUF599 domain-containing protein [Burkholderiales bacterium]